MSLGAIGTGRDTSGVDADHIGASGYLASVRRPGISRRLLGVEVGRSTGDSHNIARIDGTGRRGNGARISNRWRRYDAAEVEENTAAELSRAEIRAPAKRGAIGGNSDRWTVVFMDVAIIRLEETNPEVMMPERQVIVHAATDHHAGTPLVGL